MNSVNAAHYLRMKEKAARLPQVDVTRDEMVQRFIAAGLSPEDAELQTRLAAGLGSRVMIGDEMVGLKA